MNVTGLSQSATVQTHTSRNYVDIIEKSLIGNIANKLFTSQYDKGKRLCIVSICILFANFDSFLQEDFILLQNCKPPSINVIIFERYSYC